MGEILSITCRNKGCGYHVELRYGDGFGAFRWCRRIESEILEDKTVSEEIKRLLNDGNHISRRGIYICPSCRDFVEIDSPYVYEPVRVTPYGTVREYKLHYIFEKPVCRKCSKDLKHIFNPLSSYNMCPKCGMDNMKARKVGHFD